MPTEKQPRSAAEKAKRMLGEGRLTISRVTEISIVAECKGDSGEIYKLGWNPVLKRWVCQCEANDKFNRVCSHLRALQLVTTKPKGAAT